MTSNRRFFEFWGLRNEEVLNRRQRDPNVPNAHPLKSLNFLTHVTTLVPRVKTTVLWVRFLHCLQSRLLGHLDRHHAT